MVRTKREITRVEGGCDAPCCFRPALVNGLCEWHLDESGWETRLVFVPLAIREFVSGWLIEVAGQRNDDEMEALGKRIERMPAAANELALSRNECAILGDEFFAYSEGGGLRAMVEDGEPRAKETRVLVNALYGRAYRAMGALDKALAKRNPEPQERAS